MVPFNLSLLNKRIYLYESFASFILSTETSYTYAQFQRSGTITAPATSIPRFKKYSVDDFHFLTVLGKGSFGKVIRIIEAKTKYLLYENQEQTHLLRRKATTYGICFYFTKKIFCSWSRHYSVFRSFVTYYCS